MNIVDDNCIILILQKQKNEENSAVTFKRASSSVILEHLNPGRRSGSCTIEKINVSGDA